MIDVYSNTDWAGRPKTRKSTSGGCLMLGTHLLKSWSSTQASVSLSSGEAEFYGVLKAAGVGLGFQSLMADVGVRVGLRVWTDSSAAVGICSRQGLGKLRHIDTHALWVQQAVRTRRFSLHKVHGEANPADLFTKHMCSREKLASLIDLLGCRFFGGRAEAAPMMRQASGTRVTMASKNEHVPIDACDLETWPALPHLDEGMLREVFPPVSVPEPSGDRDLEDEQQDLIWKRGAAIGEELMRYAAKAGRRRVETVAVDQQPSDSSVGAVTLCRVRATTTTPIDK